MKPRVGHRPLKALHSIVGVVALSSFSANGASLANVSSAGASAGTAVNLTTVGSSGWAAWELPDGTTGGTSYSPFATKNGGLGTISAITRLGGGALRSPGADNSSQSFSWTTSDATGSVASPADKRLSGVFSATLSTQGQGVSLTLTNLAALTGGQTYLITLYGYSYGARGQATASIGATSVNQLSANINTTVRNAELYQFSFNPDSTDDVLTLAYAISSAGNDANAHTAIQAVAISIIPEASSAVMALAGATVLLARRKRRI